MEAFTYPGPMTMIIMIEKFSVGDYVVIVSPANYLIGPAQFKHSPKAVIMTIIDDNWSRVFMSTSNTTRIIDMPNAMLRRVDDYL